MKLLKTTLSCATLLLSSAVSANPVVIPNPPSIAAESYILMDYQTGQILAEKDANLQRAPASLTKIMSSYVLGQELKSGRIKLDDTVTVSTNAWAQNPKLKGSSLMWLREGTSVSVDELYQGMVVASGNDACIAIAEHIAGSESGFTHLMNTWAGELGMHNSLFENSHGLDANQQQSTAYDMALLTQAFIRDLPDYYKLHSQKQFTYNNITTTNRNGLLWDQSMNVDGVKTGYTSNAGYSLVSSATVDDMRLIAVVMGVPGRNSQEGSNRRQQETKTLLNYGFRFFETVTPYRAGDTFVRQPIWYGSQAEVALGTNIDTPVTIYRGQANALESAFELDQTLEAPLEKGQQVGTLYFRLGDKEVASYPLVVMESVNEGSWFSKLVDYFKLLFQSLWSA
ncbi:MAG: D-alanyl-D-alanine carboxypeptidase family protein [Ferrimonas sp.]